MCEIFCFLYVILASDNGGIERERESEKRKENEENVVKHKLYKICSIKAKKAKAFYYYLIMMDLDFSKVSDPI